MTPSVEDVVVPEEEEEELLSAENNNTTNKQTDKHNDNPTDEQTDLQSDKMDVEETKDKKEVEFNITLNGLPNEKTPYLYRNREPGYGKYGLWTYMNPSCNIALGFITHNPLMVDVIVYKPSPYGIVFIHDKLHGLCPRVYHLSHRT